MKKREQWTRCAIDGLEMLQSAHVVLERRAHVQSDDGGTEQGRGRGGGVQQPDLHRVLCRRAIPEALEEAGLAVEGGVWREHPQIPLAESACGKALRWQLQKVANCALALEILLQRLWVAFLQFSTEWTRSKGAGAETTLR